MQVFLAVRGERAAVDPEPASVLRVLARDLAPIGAGDVWSWVAPSGDAALHAISHSTDRTGGVEYRFAEELRACAFSGRPILWTEDDLASGEAPLDAACFIASPSQWVDRVDGRCAIVRYDDTSRVLTVRTDPLGSYPVYVAGQDAQTIVSNSAELLRRLIASRGTRIDVLATFSACGWALGGRPLWTGVDRLPRGVVQEWGPNGVTTRELLPTEVLASQFGAGFSPTQACADLVATIAAHAQWPGRPVALPLTGGRDSRVVLAGALAAGVDFAAETSALPHLPGYPDTADVRIARELCEAASVPHKVNIAGQRAFPLQAAIQALSRASSGTVSLGGVSPNTAASFVEPGDQLSAPLRILLSGANGETARTYYGLGDGLTDAQLVERLEGRLVPSYPAPILTREGRAIIKDYLATWVAESRQRGVGVRVVDDLFYLLERMSNWAGPLHGILEYGSDVVAPLWSPRMVRHQIALPGQQRTHGKFHSMLLEHLAPTLARHEYEGATYRQGRRALLQKRMKQARAEFNRRFGSAGSAAGDSLTLSAPAIRERVLSCATHPIWQVVDRNRAERLLDRDPRRLDPRSRDQVWRLATVVMAD